MSDLKDKLIGYTGFTVVFFLHIYFALLLGTQTALAEEMAPAPQVKVEKFDKVTPEAPVPPKPPKAPKLSDTEINIKIDPKEGLTVKGIDKMVEKLEAIDSRHRGENDDDQEVTIDQNGIKIKKNVRDEEDGDDQDESRSSGNNFGRTAVQIIVPTVLFGGFFGVMAFFLYLRYKTRKDSLETVRLFLEKGQPIPADLMTTLKGPSEASQRDWNGYQSHVLKGLKPIFWGLGIAIFFMFNHFDVTEWFFGVIFILIGAYHITKSHLIQKDKEKSAQVPSDAQTVKPEVKS